MSLFSLVRRNTSTVTSTSRFSIGPVRTADDLRFCNVIDGPQSEKNGHAGATAWKRLQQTMALIPTGATLLEPNSLIDDRRENTVINVNAFYVDRFAVTNSDYAEFVAAGVYDDMEHWPNEVWQHVLQFVDHSGVPGPQSWTGGRPPRNRLNHPVVGICWYEAMAFAKWVGKRLPDAAQWQRAASWHTGQNGQQTALSYPWGNAFESSRANTWSSSVGNTVAADKYYEGCTPNGVHQLIGNVWEWVDEAFAVPWNDDHLLAGFAEVRGGAFDTYFESQTALSVSIRFAAIIPRRQCRFPLLYRRLRVEKRARFNSAFITIRSRDNTIPMMTTDTRTL